MQLGYGLDADGLPILLLPAPPPRR